MRTSPLIRSLRQLVRRHPGLTIVPKAEGCFLKINTFISRDIEVYNDNRGSSIKIT